MRSMEAELRALRNELSNRNSSNNHTETQVISVTVTKVDDVGSFDGDIEKTGSEDNTSVFNFTVGAAKVAGTFVEFLEGDIAELLIYDHELSDSDRINIENPKITVIPVKKIAFPTAIIVFSILHLYYVKYSFIYLNRCSNIKSGRLKYRKKVYFIPFQIKLNISFIRFFFILFKLIKLMHN